MLPVTVFIGAAAGLEPEKDTIIEIACLITNGDLTKVLEVCEVTYA